MRRLLLATVSVFALASLLTPAVRAQYMYLDANGNGVHDVGDRLQALGTPTPVDVWIRTDTNKDGSSASGCPGEGALTISQYVVHLTATGGTVSYSGFANLRSEMNVAVVQFQSSNTDMAVGRGGAYMNPPGTYKLMMVTITATSGSPNINIVRNNSLPTVDVTNFASQCFGSDFDNVLKLGSDWFDVDGLGSAGPDLNPVITAPATAQGFPGNPVSITGSATDPDAGSTVTLSQVNNAPFFPNSSSAGPSANPSITLTGTPTVTSSGSFTINWSATDGTGGTATATTSLVVSPNNQSPQITAPATRSGSEFVPITVTASASDPNGNNVTLSQTNNAPFFPASSSSGPSPNPTLSVTGTPNFTQSGSFTIQWTAVDDGTPILTATATTAVTIGGDRSPVITAPATAGGTEGSPVTITVTAADPDGQNVTLCVSGKPSFLIGGPCAGPSPNPVLTISGTPGPNDAGNYLIYWTATDGVGGTATASTALAIANFNRPPVLTQPADMTVNEGEFATQPLTATDPDNDPIIFSTVGPTPLFVTVSGSFTGQGSVTLNPGYSDAGSYNVTVRASDGVLFDTKSLGITVNDVNRCPISDPGGPYTGIIGVPITFDGSGTVDPDGDPVSFAWDFGDGTTGAGAVVQHTYATNGTFTLTFTVGDGTCLGSATQEVTIVASYQALAFALGGNDVTSLNSGKPFTCVQLEPAPGAFDVTDVDIGSIRMKYSGTGPISAIPVDFGKTTVGADKNRNGISEITACFRKEDLRQLFSGLPSGRNTVDVLITGTLTAGGTFSAPLTMIVKSSGGALAASISPNPLNPRAKLTFATSKPGAVRVQMFDLSGRLVRTIVDEQNAGSGYHDFTIDGRDATGGRLASGIYFVKIWTESDGSLIKNLTVLK